MLIGPGGAGIVRLCYLGGDNMNTVYPNDQRIGGCSFNRSPNLNPKYLERLLDIGIVRELCNRTQTSIEGNR